MGGRLRRRALPLPLGHVPINAQLYNNYGPKGNGELLFTYGFAVFGNPLDTVEGIIVGCRHTSNARLAAARLRFLDEQEIPYKLQASGGRAAHRAV